MQRRLVAVENTRGKIGKKSMIHNDATPKIEIDPETYDVTADGELLVCEPATSCRWRSGIFCFKQRPSASHPLWARSCRTRDRAIVDIRRLAGAA